MTEGFKLYGGTYIKLKGKLSDYIAKAVFEEPERMTYFIRRGKFQKVGLLYVPQHESKTGYLIEDLDNEKYVEAFRRNIAEYKEHIASLGILDSPNDHTIIMFYTPYNLTQGMNPLEVELKKSVYKIRKASQVGNLEDVKYLFSEKYGPLIKKDSEEKFYLPLTPLANIKIESLLDNMDNIHYFLKTQDLVSSIVGADIGVIEAKKKLIDKILSPLRRFFK